MPDVRLGLEELELAFRFCGFAAERLVFFVCRWSVPSSSLSLSRSSGRLRGIWSPSRKLAPLLALPSLALPERPDAAPTLASLLRLRDECWLFLSELRFDLELVLLDEVFELELVVVLEV